MGRRKASMYDEYDFAGYTMAAMTRKQLIVEEQRCLGVRGIAAIASALGAIFGIMGLGASSSGIIGLIMSAGLLASFILSVLTYVRAGGTGVALSWAGKVAAFGWWICPFFPMDILVFIFVFIFAFYAIFFLPILIVNHKIKQCRMGIEAAEMYMADLKRGAMYNNSNDELSYDYDEEYEVNGAY